MLELSLNDLYTELTADPDLRRLGPYKIIASEGQTILPIDLELDGEDIYLGEGDFTCAFVALCNTRARSIDFGACKFLDLYLDEAEFERCLLSEAHASRLYFDFAKINECRFGSLVAPEVYFDSATIGTLAGEKLVAGIIYIENLECPMYTEETLRPNGYRFIEGTDQRDDQGELSEIRVGETPAVREISPYEFMQLLRENPDMSRLGPYKISLDSKEGSEQELIIDIDFDGQHIVLGEGDFTAVHVNLEGARANLLDLSESKFDSIDMGNAEIANCFLATSEIRELRFGDARIANVFGEQCRTETTHLDRLTCHQFNVNEIRAREIHLNEARVSEMYLSRGEGVEAMYCDSVSMEILNLHEGNIREFHFGDAHVTRALVNKATIDELYVEGLQTNIFYIDNALGNEINHLIFEQIAEIDHISMERAFDETDSKRRVINRIEGYASPLQYAILPEGEQAPAENRTAETELELPEKHPELRSMQEGEGPREIRGN